MIEPVEIRVSIGSTTVGLDGLDHLGLDRLDHLGLDRLDHLGLDRLDYRYAEYSDWIPESTDNETPLVEPARGLAR